MKAIKRMKLEILECTCLRCGHVWVPPLRNVDGSKWVCEKPRACSKCKSFYWDRPAQSAGKRRR